jgi:hypothetical protein
LGPGPPKAVNGLIRVSNDHDFGPGAGQQAEQAVLGLVEILVFVHQQVAAALPVGSRQVRAPGQQPDGPGQEVLVVPQPFPPERGLVILEGLQITGFKGLPRLLRVAKGLF